MDYNSLKRASCNLLNDGHVDWKTNIVGERDYKLRLPDDFQ